MAARTPAAATALGAAFDCAQWHIRRPAFDNGRLFVDLDDLRSGSATRTAMITVIGRRFRAPRVETWRMHIRRLQYVAGYRTVATIRDE